MLEREIAVDPRHSPQVGEPPKNREKNAEFGAKTHRSEIADSEREDPDKTGLQIAVAQGGRHAARSAEGKACVGQINGRRCRRRVVGKPCESHLAASKPGFTLVTRHWLCERCAKIFLGATQQIHAVLLADELRRGVR
jgi:hypothetical protein